MYMFMQVNTAVSIAVAYVEVCMAHMLVSLCLYTHDVCVTRSTHSLFRSLFSFTKKVTTLSARAYALLVRISFTSTHSRENRLSAAVDLSTHS